MFKRIKLSGWRQFSDIDIVFHDHLTVLTGANGAGKTTVLNLLSELVGWDPQFVSAYKTNDNGQAKYYNSLAPNRNEQFIRDTDTNIVSNNDTYNKLGELESSDGEIIDLLIPNDVREGIYQIHLGAGKKEKGVYVNSHRPTFPYKALKSIPTEVVSREQIYAKYIDFNKRYIFDTYRDPNELSATSLVKETLASLAVFSYESPSIRGNKEVEKLFQGYIKILKKVLPKELGFENISMVVPEIMMCTKTGDFPLDAVSGGISSIIDITWQLYMFAEPTDPFVALIDEPENHLHPALQKNFLGNLIEAFPHVQFIVATHNPFMITAQKDSNVYVLDYDENHKVHSSRLDYVNRAGTSNAILRDVLGLDSTIPLWAVNELEEIITKYSQTDLSENSFNSLREELKKIGLGDYIPETITKVIKKALGKND